MTKEDIIKLPPDQSFRSYQRGEITIFHSVSEGGFLLGKNSDVGESVLTSPKGYHIFAESIRLTDSFHVDLDSKAVVSLSTRDLYTTSESASHLNPDIAILAAAGKDNNSGQTLSDPTTLNGKPAGALSLYVENFTSENAAKLLVLAKGGDGGDTCESGATAGKGGKGGKAQLVVYSALMGTSLLLNRFARNKTYRALDDSSVLTVSHPIIADLNAILDSVAHITHQYADKLLVGSLCKLFEPIQAICDRSKSSDNSPTAKAAGDAVWEVRTALSGRLQDDRHNITTSFHVEGGQPGSYVNTVSGPRGSAGEQGEQGSLAPALFFVDLDPVALRNQSIVTVHPVHCEMLFERAMTYWYFGTDNCRRRAVDLLERLLFRLAFLPLQPSDPLYNAYESQQASLQAPDSLKRLTSLKDQAMAQLCVVESGKVDFYGYPHHWVPRVSWDYYRNILNDALKVYATLEASYIRYHAAVEQKHKVNDAVQQAKSEIDSTIEKINGEKKDVIKRLQQLERKFLSSAPDLEQKHFAFETAYDKLVHKIKAAHGVTAGQFISALSAMASKLEDAVSHITNITGLTNDWNNSVVNDNDVRVNKKYLLNKLKRSVATGLENFTADLKPDELNGDFAVDKTLPKLLIEEGKLNELLADYSSASFGEAGADLEAKFKAFTDALTTRNNDIVSYNALLQVIRNALNQVDKLKDMKRAADKDTIIGPDLEQMTEYMRVIYDSSRARVMRYLSIGQRALTFKILRSEDLLSMNHGSKGRLDADDIPLSMTSDILLAIRSNLDDLLLRGMEEEGVSPTRFPADWEKGTGKRRWLSTTELQTFLQMKKISLPIAPVFPGQNPDALSSGFRSSANVRVYRVAFYLKGLKALRPTMEGEEPVFISNITHSGKETIVSTRGVRNDFEHDRLDIIHSYRVGVDGPGRIIDNGEFIKMSHNDKDSIFGAPGPFTTWEVDSHDADWDKFDVQEVIRAGGYLEFFGTDYAFKSSV